MADFAHRGISRRLIVSGATLAIGAAAFTGIAHGFDEASKSDVNVDAKGVALRGYDPVSYQTGAKPVLGTQSFTATHDGATYQFASASNRDAFRANPARYAPAYGGFCAMGVAMGRKLDGDPTLYRVVDNKLFLNVNQAVQARWVQDIPGNVLKAQAEWPALRGKTPRETNN